MENDLIVQYFIINNDLKMSPGKVCSQVSHVTTIITLDMCNPKSSKGQMGSRLISKWMNTGKTVITLQANQQQMEKLKELTHLSYYIIDEGRTEIAPNSLTVVGFPPMEKSNIQKIMLEACGERLRLY